MSFRPSWDDEDFPQEPVPPPRTAEQDAWLKQPDPYAPVGEALTTALGIGDLGGQYQAGQDAYAKGVPAPAPEKKGEGAVQTVVDIQNSGLGQAIGGLLPYRQITPTTQTPGLLPKEQEPLPSYVDKTGYTLAQMDQGRREDELQGLFGGLVQGPVKPSTVAPSRSIAPFRR